jgi:putative hydrolase of the HAD superfamily
MKTVLFDIDGVINSTHRLNLEKFGISHEAIQPFFKGPFSECLVGKVDTKEILEPYLREWRFPGTIEDFLHHWHTDENNTRLEMVALIEELQQLSYRVCAATNQEKYRTAYLRNEMGYSQIFDYVFSSCEIGFKKPDVEFFTYILHNLGVLPSNVIFFDDTPSHIDGAKTVGIQAHIYQSTEECRRIIGI